VQENKTHSQESLQKLFVEEFRRAGKNPPPECKIGFHAYTGLTNTIRARNGRVLVRISDLLVQAPREILRSVLAILIHKFFRHPIDDEIRLRYRRYINRPEFRRQVHQIRRKRGSKRLSSPQGRCFNLMSLYRELNQVYFENQLRIRHISWSQRANRVTLGHFDSAHSAIIINRRLDSPHVPTYVVSYVIYHEMLHASLGEELAGDGRQIHHRRFREAEQRFQEYTKATEFIQTRYQHLIRRDR
jgi:hypothetical protein